jgi:hypothetical protein
MRQNIGNYAARFWKLCNLTRMLCGKNLTIMRYFICHSYCIQIDLIQVQKEKYSLSMIMSCICEHGMTSLITVVSTAAY